MSKSTSTTVSKVTAQVVQEKAALAKKEKPVEVKNIYKFYGVVYES